MGIIVLGIVGVCGGAGASVVNKFLDHKVDTRDADFRIVRGCARGFRGEKMVEILVSERTYIVLLQNNMELRPSGGFMGSYARIGTDARGMREVFVQDIYEPDGQIPGHVEPPAPIQEAFGQGWWKLRDANWDVDYKNAADDVKWFLEQGGEKQIDGLMAINLSSVKRVIGVVGEIKLVTYDETVTENNFYALAQSEAEMEFKPGSTQKRDFLGAVGTTLLELTKGMGVRDLVRLAGVVVGELRRGEMMMWSGDGDIQHGIEKIGWAGRLEEGWDGKSDYLYIVESNLGANKANCCIDRSVRQEIQAGLSRLTLGWTNNNPGAKPNPPETWGGDYIDYVRVVIPKELAIRSINVTGEELKKKETSGTVEPNSLLVGRNEREYETHERGKLQIVGFWAVVPAGQELVAKIELSNRRMRDQEYKVLVKKQPGMENISYELMVDEKIEKRSLVDRARVFVIK